MALDDPELARKAKYALGGYVLPQFINFDDWEQFEVPWLMGGISHRTFDGPESRNVRFG